VCGGRHYPGGQAHSPPTARGSSRAPGGLGASVESAASSRDQLIGSRCDAFAPKTTPGITRWSKRAKVDVHPCTHQTSSASRSDSISALVIRTPCDGKGRKPATERPLMEEDCPPSIVPAMAWRNKREMTVPADTRCRLAISFAAARTSSSISIVVRIGHFD
jgi:hypothetical protein